MTADDWQLVKMKLLNIALTQPCVYMTEWLHMKEAYKMLFLIIIIDNLS